MKAVVVHNSKSGSALDIAELQNKLESAGIDVTSMIEIGDYLDEDLAPHIKNNDVAVVGYGGDGTLSAIANVLAGKKTIFIPLPGGTLNHFTKDLGIAQDLDQALKNLNDSKPCKVDVTRVNEQVFLNNSSIGLYSSALQMRDEMERKSIGKWPAAVLASFKAFWRYRSYTVTIDGETFKTPFVFIGNNDYRLEHNLIGERVRLDEGKLSVYAITHSSRLRLFKVFMRALFGRLKSADEVKIWKSKSLMIRSKKACLHVSRDGEHEWIDAPLKYDIMPGALTVLGVTKNT